MADNSEMLRTKLTVRPACESPNCATADWDLVGRAAVIVSDEMRACRAALQRVAVDAGMQFIFISENEISDLPSLAAFQLKSPVLVSLEPGPWMLASKDGEPPEKSEAHERIRSQLITSLRAFDAEHPVVFATSAFAITDIAESLRHIGLFDRFLNLPAPTMDAHGNAVIERIGRDKCAESITRWPAKVGQLFRIEYEDSRREEMALLRLRRLIACEARPLEFIDLVNVVTHGFIEEDLPPAEAADIRRQTAYHEAGHAVVAIIDSDGRNIPDYSSIVPSANFKGVVVQSYQYHADLGDRITYELFRHRIRISLAGRAAEELAFGAEHVSNGATSDLEKATGFSIAAFTFWGFAPSMGDEGRSASNLSVAKLDGDEFSASEAARIEGLVREFLAIEYMAVKKMLAEHRPLVHAIADRLMWDPIVDQHALMELATAHNLAGAS